MLSTTPHNVPFNHMGKKKQYGHVTTLELECNPYTERWEDSVKHYPTQCPLQPYGYNKTIWSRDYIVYINNPGSVDNSTVVPGSQDIQSWNGFWSFTNTC